MKVESWASHPLFDVEARIVKAGNQPSPVDMAPFQEELNRICGTAPNGLPLLKLEWGQDIGNKMVVCGTLRLRFPFYRYIVRHEGVSPLTGVWGVWDELHEIGTPRFYVSEYHSTEELGANDGWEKSRWVWQNGQLIDTIGPMPEQGFYTTLFTVAHHDKWCCAGREQRKGQPCLGAYRVPGEEDLFRVRRMKWNRDHASNDEYAPSDALVAKQSEEFREKRDQLWQDRIDQSIDNFFAVHSFKFASHSDKLQRWGKYNFGATKSGMSEEDRIKLLKGIKNGSSDGTAVIPDNQ